LATVEIVIVVPCSGVEGKPDKGAAEAASGVAFAAAVKAGLGVLGLLLFIIDIVNNSIAIHSEGGGRMATTIDCFCFVVMAEPSSAAVETYPLITKKSWIFDRLLVPIFRYIYDIVKKELVDTTCIVMLKTCFV
jgi:hypothetical protein